MAREWGPVEKPVEHDVKGIAADEGGAVTAPSPSSKHRGEITNNEHYDATDSRHSKSEHAGWVSAGADDGGVGPDGVTPTHRFPDGPDRWRQT